MNIRDAITINQILGMSALPYGFVSVPIFSYMDKYNLNDDLAGCKYIDSVTSAIRNDNSNFIDYWYIADFTREPLAEALNVDKDEIKEKTFTQV